MTVPALNLSGRPPPQSAEWEARGSEDRRLFERYRRTGDPAVQDTLVRRFLPLVRGLAWRYRHTTSEPFDDLMQVGSMGLLKAIERYDPGRETAFSSFAVPTITGELKRHFRDRTWSVKVPRGAKEGALRLGSAERELEGTLGRSPTTAEIAAALKIGIEEVLDARTAAMARSTESLEGPRGGEDDGQHLMDAFQVVEPGFGAAEDAALLAGLLPSLDDRGREVLRLRFDEDLTQAEIAQRMGYSQMHISRLIRASIARLAAVDTARAGADRL